MSTTFNARQRAELRDSMARTRVDAHAEMQRLARLSNEHKVLKRAATTPRAVKPRTEKPVEWVPPVVPPRFELPLPPATAEEAALVARLLPNVCIDSVVDRERHALGVARLILNCGGRRGH